MKCEDHQPPQNNSIKPASIITHVAGGPHWCLSTISDGKYNLFCQSVKLAGVSTKYCWQYGAFKGIRATTGPHTI